MILHKSIKLLIRVVDEGVHAGGDAVLALQRLVLLLPTLMLHWAVRGGVRLRQAEVAHDRRAVAQQLLRAVLELVTLLSAGLAPNAPEGQVVVHDDFQLLGLVCLVQDGLDHRAALLQVLIRVSCDKDVEGFLVPLLLVVDLGPVLGAVAAHTNATLTLLFEFLLRLAAGSNDLPDVVQRGVIGLGDVDLALLLGGLVVGRRRVARVDRDHLVDQLESLLVVLVLEALVARVLPQARLAVVDGLGGGRADVSVVLLVVLGLNARL